MKKATITAFLIFAGVVGVLAGGSKLAVAQEVTQSFPSIADLAEVLSPTVVYIENIERQARSDVPESHNNPYFRHFFGDPNGPRTGAGSGVIVSGDGHIITNHHVVDRADEIQVTLTDGRVFPAEVIGSDPEIDLAVIKIKADDLFYAKLGRSQPVRVGDWVVAIGNPLGYRYTVTFGIVSALSRGNGLNHIENYIQTDAAINRGNSGGPLINMKGEVIGINTAISADGQNIGFAVPMDLIRPSYDQIIESGSVSRGALGIRLQPLTPELKEYYGTSKGVLVADVPAGPAQRAGIKQGDLITAFNGEEVENSAQLISRVAVNRPGKEITLTVVRDGKESQFSFKLGDRKQIFSGVAVSESSAPENESVQTVKLDELGVVLERIGEQQAATGFYQAGDYVISEIAADSPLREKGAAPGLVLIRINDLDVTPINIKKIRAELNASGVVRLQIKSDRGTRLIGVRPLVNQN